MRIFLTGSTGFIGQSLVRAMRRRDWAVQVLVRDQKGTAAQWLSDQGCTLVAGDVTRPEVLARAMAGADAVVHAAGVYELGVNANERERMQQVNVDGTNKCSVLHWRPGLTARYTYRRSGLSARADIRRSRRYQRTKVNVTRVLI